MHVLCRQEFLFKVLHSVYSHNCIYKVTIAGPNKVVDGLQISNYNHSAHRKSFCLLIQTKFKKKN